MRKQSLLAFFLQFAVFAALLSAAPAARAQLTAHTDIDLSQKPGDDSECAISKNPSNPNQLFAFCNVTSGPGLFAARSIDGGVTWTYPDPADKTIADGDPGQGPAACCDPTSSWDSFGNLYLTYINSSINAIVTLLSTDGGATFTPLATFSGSVDQPTVVAANTTAPGAPVAVWIVWNQSGQMVARGAAVTGLGAVGAFNPLQTIPGTSGCSFGDIAIAPSGVVVQVCESPSGGSGPANLLVNIDGDGLGPSNFGAPITATATNVGGFHPIPPQPNRTVDAEAGLAFDSRPGSPHFGRLYLVYSSEPSAGDTDIQVRFSDNNGSSWSAPIRVNDDPPGRSQFLPRIFVDPTSSYISVCWHDSRNSATNTSMEEYCTIAPPTGATPVFEPNVRVGDGASTSNGAGIEFGDYSGLAYVTGVIHPAWADTSNSTGNNPNGTANFDAYTDRITGGTTAPQIQVPNGVAFGNICLGGKSTGTLNVCNTGTDDLVITSITSSNPQFSIVTPSAGFPVTVSHDFCFPFSVIFTPTGSGPQTSTITIVTNDPSHPTVTVQATAQVGVGSLSLDADILFPPTVIQSVGSCYSPKPLVVSNKGTCDLTITSIAIGGANAGDYALSGTPGFPVTVEPGHTVGEGDLNAIFGPRAVARERTADVTVTFVSDPTSGTTSTQTAQLCGEGVRTGARVLVTQGGVPMPKVHEIELKRLHGGWFGFAKEVDEVKNALLQTVTATPGTACASFQFHREYGAVTDAEQLVPGVYQLKVEAIIAGKEVRKKTFFQVGTCGFDGTIVVDF